MAIVLERTKKLIEALTNGAELSIDDIKMVIGTKSKVTVYSYLDECRKAGLSIASKRNGRKVVFYCDKDSNSNVYPKMVSTDVEKFLILERMRELGAITKKDAVQTEKINLIVNVKLDKEQVIDGALLDTKRTHFYKLITEMLDEKLIIANRTNKKDTREFYIADSSIEEVDDDYFAGNEVSSWEALYDMICQVPDTHPYYEQLKSVEKKLGYAIGETEYISKDDLFVVFGRSHHGNEKLQEYLGLIHKYDYVSHLLKVGIKTNSGYEYMYVGVAYIIYSLDQDSIYLCGKKTTHPKSRSSNKYTDCLVRLSSNLLIENTQYANIFYKDELIRERIKHMIGVTSDADEDSVTITISQDSSIYIKEKLINLKCETDGIIRYENGKMIYSGSVVGRGNMQKLLRQLGDNLIDVNDKNDIYKNYLASTSRRTLESYKEYFNGR